MCLEHSLPSTLVEQTWAAASEQQNEIDDAELLQAVMAMERTESDDGELSDDELLSAVVSAENSSC